MARVVVPGFPYHITQRGNRRQRTFFHDEEHQTYIWLMAEWCSRLKVEVWTYCLMPNHMHLIAFPQSEEGLQCAIGEGHRRYTREINFREGWRGHMWQGRFTSLPLDENYLLAAARYVELNLVRAKLVDNPEAYKWSSAVAHHEGQNDEPVKVSPLLGLIGNWREFLSQAATLHQVKELRRHE